MCNRRMVTSKQPYTWPLYFLSNPNHSFWPAPFLVVFIHNLTLCLKHAVSVFNRLESGHGATCFFRKEISKRFSDVDYGKDTLPPFEMADIVTTD